MPAAIWLPPLVKALTTALIVVSASAVAEALGPFWGALIASLPVSAGPAYVFLSLQHGPDFIAGSALSSFAANAAAGSFLTVYALLARTRSPWSSLGAALLAWLAVSLATRQVAWTPVSALLLNLCVYSAGLVAVRRTARAGMTVVPPARRRWFELPARAVAVAAFVSLVVAASSLLGPSATGIAAVFPISFTSLIAIVRPRLGGAAASLLAASALWPMVGFGFVLLTLHLAARPWGSTVALCAAMSVSIFWSVALLIARSSYRSAQPAILPRVR